MLHQKQSGNPATDSSKKPGFGFASFAFNQKL
jgi:hypothetical protein